MYSISLRDPWHTDVGDVMTDPTAKFKYWGELARTFIAIIGVVTMIGTPAWRWWLMPTLVSNMSTAMAQDIQTRVDTAVEKKIAPINAGLKAIIQGNIMNLSERIDALVYKRDFPPIDDWTDSDRQELYDLNQELKLQRDALAKIYSSEQINN